MVGLAANGFSARSIRQQISSAVDLFIQVSRFPDGTRRVTHITEASGMEGEQVTTQDIFVFERTSMVQGRVRGRFTVQAYVRSSTSGWSPTKWHADVDFPIRSGDLAAK